MRVMLDTNVIAASIVGNHLRWKTPPSQILRLWHNKQFTLLLSEHLIAELNKTLDQTWFVARIDSPSRDLAMTELFALGKLIEPSNVITGIASHPADDLILSAAISGNADYLVTGDAQFRRVDEYQGVKIRTPAEFLRELDELSF